MNRLPRWLLGVVTSAALVAAVTAVVALSEPRVPALGLGVLYLLAVVPIALVYGAVAAGVVSLVSMAAFSYLFLPPRHHLSPGNSERWSVLLAFLLSSVIVSQLAARAQREARRSAHLAAEQVALRRVATLVARGVAAPEIFAAAAREVGLILGADATHLTRYELDGTGTEVAAWSPAGDHLAVGTRVELEGESVAGSVLRTGRPARIGDYQHASGRGGELGRELGLRSSVGAPIVVDQRLWGVMIASSKGDSPLPEAAEVRIAAFTELLATAIANAESRFELAASRRRIVAAADETRRQIERDLHDGMQQRLVSVRLAVRAAEANVPSERDDLREELSAIARDLAATVDDLLEISRGIHPAILSKGGLGPALRTLAGRSTVPVAVDIPADEPFPAEIEVTAYFIASEALANVVKHAQASRVDLSLAARNGDLLLSIRDDGIGGADLGSGSGLVGLTDRVAALGGTIAIKSAPGAGTSLVVTLPLGAERTQE